MNDITKFPVTITCMQGHTWLTFGTFNADDQQRLSQARCPICDSVYDTMNYWPDERNAARLACRTKHMPKHA